MRVYPAGKMAIWPVVITSGEDWLLAYNAGPLSASLAGPGQGIHMPHRWDLSVLLGYWPEHATHACLIQDDVPVAEDTMRYIATRVGQCRRVDMYGPAIRRSLYSPSVALAFSKRVLRTGFLDLSCAVLSREMVELYEKLAIEPGDFGWHISPLLGAEAEYVWVDHSVEAYHVQERPDKLSGLVGISTYNRARQEAEEFMGPGLETKVTFGYNHRIWSPSSERRAKGWQEAEPEVSFKMVS